MVVSLPGASVRSAAEAGGPAGYAPRDDDRRPECSLAYSVSTSDDALGGLWAVVATVLLFGQS